ncbi:hypothetical protein KIPB_000757 [Kipferlia bialata]|uniref:Uncharacterized protein n=1 Tax=Kipferlia bialata TaxID=797122 RepID=A0A9K3CPA7_9EUKA|nr:hypothetical protein KIPB_000757 [Kipferlia bialata]|eukprot:g757.t1
MRASLLRVCALLFLLCFIGLSFSSPTPNPTIYDATNTDAVVGMNQVKSGTVFDVFTVPTPVLLMPTEEHVADPASDTGGTMAVTSGYSGYSVSVSDDGTWMATGAHGVNAFMGSAYVYEAVLTSGTYEYAALQTLTPPSDSVPSDSRLLFGQQVSMDPSGTLLAVSAPSEAISGTSAVGAVHMYRNVAGTWTYEARLQPPAASVSADMAFGYSVAVTVSDVYILADGGLFTCHTSAVGVWDPVYEVTTPVEGAFDRTVGQMAVSGDWLAVASERLLYMYDISQTGWDVPTQYISHGWYRTDDEDQYLDDDYLSVAIREAGGTGRLVLAYTASDDVLVYTISPASGVWVREQTLSVPCEREGLYRVDGVVPRTQLLVSSAAIVVSVPSVSVIFLHDGTLWYSYRTLQSPVGYANGVTGAICVCTHGMFMGVPQMGRWDTSTGVYLYESLTSTSMTVYAGAVLDSPVSDTLTGTVYIQDGSYANIQTELTVVVTLNGSVVLGALEYMQSSTTPGDADSPPVSVTPYTYILSLPLAQGVNHVAIYLDGPEPMPLLTRTLILDGVSAVSPSTATTTLTATEVCSVYTASVQLHTGPVFASPLPVVTENACDSVYIEWGGVVTASSQEQWNPATNTCSLEVVSPSTPGLPYSVYTDTDLGAPAVTLQIAIPTLTAGVSALTSSIGMTRFTAPGSTLSIDLYPADACGTPIPDLVLTVRIVHDDTGVDVYDDTVLDTGSDALYSISHTFTTVGAHTVSMTADGVTVTQPLLVSLSPSTVATGLPSPDVSLGVDSLGSVKAVYGDWVVVNSAPYTDHEGGVLYMYQEQTGSDYMVLRGIIDTALSDKVTVEEGSDDDGGAGSWTDTAVDMQGDLMAVGYPYTSVDGQTQVGAVHVYRVVGSDWSLETTLFPPVPIEGLGFGTGVYVYGDNIVIQGNGHVFTCQYSSGDGTWGTVNSVTPPSPNAFQSTTLAMSIGANSLWVVDTGDDTLYGYNLSQSSGPTVSLSTPYDTQYEGEDSSVLVSVDTTNASERVGVVRSGCVVSVYQWDGSDWAMQEEVSTLPPGLLAPIQGLFFSGDSMLLLDAASVLHVFSVVSGTWEYESSTGTDWGWMQVDSTSVTAVSDTHVTKTPLGGLGQLTVSALVDVTYSYSSPPTATVILYDSTGDRFPSQTSVSVGWNDGTPSEQGVVWSGSDRAYTVTLSPPVWTDGVQALSVYTNGRLVSTSTMYVSSLSLDWPRTASVTLPVAVSLCADHDVSVDVFNSLGERVNVDLGASLSMGWDGDTPVSGVYSDVTDSYTHTGAAPSSPGSHTFSVYVDGAAIGSQSATLVQGLSYDLTTLSLSETQVAPGETVVITLEPRDTCGAMLTSGTYPLNVRDVGTGVTSMYTLSYVPGDGAFTHSYSTAGEGVRQVEVTMPDASVLSVTLNVATATTVVEEVTYHVSAATSTLSGVAGALGAYTVTLTLMDLTGTPIGTDLSPEVLWDGDAMALEWDDPSSTYSATGTLCDGHFGTSSFSAKVEGVEVATQSLVTTQTLHDASSYLTAPDHVAAGEVFSVELYPIDYCGDAVPGLALPLSITSEDGTSVLSASVLETTPGVYSYPLPSGLSVEGEYTVTLSLTGLASTSIPLVVAAAVFEDEGVTTYVSSQSSTLSYLPTTTGNYNVSLELADLDGVSLLVDLSPGLTVNGVVSDRVYWTGSSYNMSGTHCSLGTATFVVSVGASPVLEVDASITTTGPMSQMESVFTVPTESAVGVGSVISVEPKDACLVPIPSPSVQLSIKTGPTPTSISRVTAVETSPGVFTHTFTPTHAGTYTVSARVNSDILHASMSGRSVDCVATPVGGGDPVFVSAALSSIANMPSTVPLGAVLEVDLSLHDAWDDEVSEELVVSVGWEGGAAGSVSYDSVFGFYTLTLTAPSASTALGTSLSLSVSVGGCPLLTESIYIVQRVYDEHGSPVDVYELHGLDTMPAEMGTCHSKSIFLQLLDAGGGVVSSVLSVPLLCGWGGVRDVPTSFTSPTYTLDIQAPSDEGLHTLSCILDSVVYTGPTVDVYQQLYGLGFLDAAESSTPGTPFRVTVEPEDRCLAPIEGLTVTLTGTDSQGSVVYGPYPASEASGVYSHDCQIAAEGVYTITAALEELRTTGSSVVHIADASVTVGSDVYHVSSLLNTVSDLPSHLSQPFACRVSLFDVAGVVVPVDLSPSVTWSCGTVSTVFESGTSEYVVSGTAGTSSECVLTVTVGGVSVLTETVPLTPSPTVSAVLSGVDAPTCMAVGEAGTISVTAVDEYGVAVDDLLVTVSIVTEPLVTSLLSGDLSTVTRGVATGTSTPGVYIYTYTPNGEGSFSVTAYAGNTSLEDTAAGKVSLYDVAVSGGASHWVSSRSSVTDVSGTVTLGGAATATLTLRDASSVVVETELPVTVHWSDLTPGTVTWDVSAHTYTLSLVAPGGIDAVGVHSFDVSVDGRHLLSSDVSVALIVPDTVGGGSDVHVSGVSVVYPSAAGTCESMSLSVQVLDTASVPCTQDITSLVLAGWDGDLSLPAVFNAVDTFSIATAAPNTTGDHVFSISLQGEIVFSETVSVSQIPTSLSILSLPVSVVPETRFTLSVAPLDACGVVIEGLEVEVRVADSHNADIGRYTISGTGGVYEMDTQVTVPGQYSVTLSVGTVSVSEALYVAHTSVTSGGAVHYISTSLYTLTGMPTVSGEAFDVRVGLYDVNGTLIPDDISPSVTWDCGSVSVAWVQGVSQYAVSGTAPQSGECTLSVGVNGVSITTRTVSFVDPYILSQAQSTVSTASQVSVGDTLTVSVYPRNQEGVALLGRTVSVSVLLGPLVTVLRGDALETTPGVYTYTYTPTEEGTYTVSGYVGSVLLECTDNGVVSSIVVDDNGSDVFVSSTESSVTDLAPSVSLGSPVECTLTLRDGWGTVVGGVLPVSVEWGDGVSGSVVHQGGQYSLSLPARTSFDECGVRNIVVYVDGSLVLSRSVSVGVFVEGVYVSGITGVSFDTLSTCGPASTSFTLHDTAGHVASDLSSYIVCGLDGALDSVPVWDGDSGYSLVGTAPPTPGAHSFECTLDTVQVDTKVLDVTQTPSLMSFMVVPPGAGVGEDFSVFVYPLDGCGATIHGAEVELLVRDIDGNQLGASITVTDTVVGGEYTHTLSIPTDGVYSVEASVSVDDSVSVVLSEVLSVGVAVSHEGEMIYVSPSLSSISDLPTYQFEAFIAKVELRDVYGSLISANLSPSVEWDCASVSLSHSASLSVYRVYGRGGMGSSCTMAVSLPSAGSTPALLLSSVVPMQTDNTLSKTVSGLEVAQQTAVGAPITITVYPRNSQSLPLTVLDLTVSVLSGPSPVAIERGQASEVATGQYAYTYTPASEGTYTVSAYVGSTLLEETASGVVSLLLVSDHNLGEHYVSTQSTLSGVSDTLGLGDTLTGNLSLIDALGTQVDTPLDVYVQWDCLDDSDPAEAGLVEWHSASNTYAVSIFGPTGSHSIGQHSLGVYVGGSLLLSKSVQVAIKVTVDPSDAFYPSWVGVATTKEEVPQNLWIGGVSGLSLSHASTCEELSLSIQLLDEAGVLPVGVDLSSVLTAGWDGEHTLAPLYSQAEQGYVLGLEAPPSPGSHTLSLSLRDTVIREMVLEVAQVAVPELSTVVMPSSIQPGDPLTLSVRPLDACLTHVSGLSVRVLLRDADGNTVSRADAQETTGGYGYETSLTEEGEYSVVVKYGTASVLTSVSVVAEPEVETPSPGLSSDHLTLVAGVSLIVSVLSVGFGVYSVSLARKATTTSPTSPLKKGRSPLSKRVLSPSSKSILGRSLPSLNVRDKPSSAKGVLPSPDVSVTKVSNLPKLSAGSMRLHTATGMPLNNVLVPVTIDSLGCRGRVLPVVVRNGVEKAAFERDLAALCKYSHPKCSGHYLQVLGYAEVGFLMGDHAGAATPSSLSLSAARVTVSGSANSDLVDSVITACDTVVPPRVNTIAAIVFADVEGVSLKDHLSVAPYVDQRLQVCLQLVRAALSSHTAKSPLHTLFESSIVVQPDSSVVVCTHALGNMARDLAPPLVLKRRDSAVKTGVLEAQADAGKTLSALADILSRVGGQDVATVVAGLRAASSASWPAIAQAYKRAEREISDKLLVQPRCCREVVEATWYTRTVGCVTESPDPLRGVYIGADKAWEVISRLLLRGVSASHLDKMRASVEGCVLLDIPASTHSAYASTLSVSRLSVSKECPQECSRILSRLCQARRLSLRGSLGKVDRCIAYIGTTLSGITDKHLPLVHVGPLGRGVYMTTSLQAAVTTATSKQGALSGSEAAGSYPVVLCLEVALGAVVPSLSPPADGSTPPPDIGAGTAYALVVKGRPASDEERATLAQEVSTEGCMTSGLDVLVAQEERVLLFAALKVGDGRLSPRKAGRSGERHTPKGMTLPQLPGVVRQTNEVTSEI